MDPKTTPSTPVDVFKPAVFRESNCEHDVPKYPGLQRQIPVEVQPP